MKRIYSHSNGTLSEPITEREQEILALLAKRYTNREIADSLHLALSTVKWYTRQIFGKLAVENRREAVERAKELSLLGADPRKAVPNNLPAPMTAFVGREQETAEIIHFLTKGGTRLLTLHGVGGSGKTRLVIEAASRLIDEVPEEFSDGIWFISLASLQNPASLPQLVASTVGYLYFDREKNLLYQLLDYLRQRHFLLILDNFEHLISTEGLHVLTEIITHAPHGKLVVTSRTRLRVLGEQSFSVMGMQVPQKDSDLEQDWRSFGAMQLFLESARRSQQALEVAEQDISSIIRICQLVEGMPLGIEMAAAWLELFTPREIVAGIEDNLDFLQVQSSEKRHQSVRIIFETSWRLLSEEEQGCLKILTVFQGSFTREAAQQVSGASRDTFLSLVNKSWLTQDAGERYHIHELLRQYGYENLLQRPAAWKAARDAHAYYYAGLLHDLGEEMKGFRQVQAFRRTGIEFENIRVAWTWLTEQGQIPFLIEQFLPGLFLYAEATWRSADVLPLVQQAHQRLDKNLDNDQASIHKAILTLAEVVFSTEFFSLRETGGAELLWGKGLSADKVMFAWDVLRKKTAEEVNGFWLIICAHLYAWPTDPVAGLQRLKVLRETFKEDQEAWLRGVAGLSLARVVSGYGYFYTAVKSPLSIDDHKERDREIAGILRESLRCFRVTGDSLKQAHTLQIQAAFAEDSRAQITSLQQAKELFEKVGDITTSSLLLFDLAEAQIRLGNHQEAFQCFHEQQRIFRWLGNRRLLSIALSWESIEALRYDTLEHARQARNECIAIVEELLLENVRVNRNSDHLDIEYAWALYELGEIERVAGNLEQARRNYEEANEIFDRQGIVAGKAFYHCGMGRLALAQAEDQTAGQHFETSIIIVRSAPHAWIEVCALCGAAVAAIGLRQYEAARSFLIKGLNVSHVLDHRELFMIVFAGLASLHAAEERTEQAIEISSFVLHDFAAWNEIKQQAKHIIQEASRGLPRSIARGAKKHGEKWVLDEVIENYLDMK